MTYTQIEKRRVARWKSATTVLPAAAKAPAPYVNKQGSADGPAHDFCVPAEHATLSLLPEVRVAALALFAELGIPWHAGVGGGPSNHLLSSQVQCVNALGQMVWDPTRIARAFGGVMDVGEVLPIEPGRYLTFEYVGPTDFFDESPTGPRIRGAHCTSVDAAFLHQAGDGVLELVLVEWKYTEYYRVRAPDAAKDAVRLGRYGAALADPSGPVRGDLLAFKFLLDEPFYQLMRQQLLAHALEVSGAEGASRVRLVHVLSPDNHEYQLSLARPEHRALGGTVDEVWSQLLRRPGRFAKLDSAVFLDPEITSREYSLRHADDVVYGLPELLAHLDMTEPDGLEDTLDVEADLLVTTTGLELVAGRVGHVLDYPFRLTELYEVIEEIEQQWEADLP